MIADSTRPLASPTDSGSASGILSRPPIYLPLAALLIATMVDWYFNVDLSVAQRAYDGNGGWSVGDLWIVRFLYRYSTWPAIAVSISAAAVWIGSHFEPRLRPHRPLALFLMLVLLLGPGLLINGVLKQFGGRPRPREVVNFGGQSRFVPAGELRWGREGRSFPSGHASMGFYWLALCVFYWERNRQWAAGFAVAGLLHGALIGYGRIAQGAHWLSDVYWSAMMVYLVAWLLYRLLRLGPAERARFLHEPSPNLQQPLGG